MPTLTIRTRYSVIFLLVVGLTLAATAAVAQPLQPAANLKLFSSQPAIQTLQALQLGGEEPTVAYIYDDRVEFYDEALVGEIDRLNNLPATSRNGVLFTEVFLTQFTSSDDLYLVQRGWSKDGNCTTHTIKLGVGLMFEPEGDTCSGDPCSYCKPFSPQFGCECNPGFGSLCNHTTGSPE